MVIIMTLKKKHFTKIAEIMTDLRRNLPQDHNTMIVFDEAVRQLSFLFSTESDGYKPERFYKAVYGQRYHKVMEMMK